MQDVDKLKNLFVKHPEILNLRMFFFTFTAIDIIHLIRDIKTI